MATLPNGNLRPDGFSASWTPTIPRLGLIGIGGTYYWNPGSDTAPSVTLTGMYGRGHDFWTYPSPLASGNLGFIFRRNGMTSADTLGPGTSSTVSTVLPSVTVNSSIPVENGIPQPQRSKVSSVEAGVSNSIGASGAATFTATPRQVADYMSYVSPAMGPEDQLSPFVRTLQSSLGTIGQSSQPPIRFLSSPDQNPLGYGMTGWGSSVDATGPRYAVQPAVLPQEEPGGLLGRLQAYVRNNPEKFPMDGNGLPNSAQPAPSADQPGGLLGRLLERMRDNPDN